MSGCFGLIDDPGNPYHFPSDRLVEARPCVDVFALYREGTGLATREGEIEIDGNRIAVRPHTHLSLSMFACPRCNRGCYRLYEAAGVWACRSCHRLDYACRHKHRSIPWLNRALCLRRKIGAPAVPFSPIAPIPRTHPAKRRLVAEILALEVRLLEHLRYEVNNVIASRYERKDRPDRPQKRKRHSGGPAQP